MKKIEIIFWGTPQFSIPSLERLVKNPRINVKAVVTQPDKPIKRSAKPVPPPVKEVAESFGLPCIQETNSKKLAEALAVYGTYDANVIVAYGKLIPEKLITIPTKGSVNLHPSLLPKYRGPSPIHYALLHGDSQTGISIMLIDEEMDHGPILAQQEEPITPDDTYVTLLERLAVNGANLLVQTLIEYVDGALTADSQDHTKATYTSLLSKDDGVIDWSSSQKIVHNRMRALNPWPGSFTFFNGKRLLIHDAEPVTAKTLDPGRVAFSDSALFIGTASGDVKINKLQLEGKAPQTAKAFMKGYPKLENAVLPS